MAKLVDFQTHSIHIPQKNHYFSSEGIGIAEAANSKLRLFVSNSNPSSPKAANIKKSDEPELFTVAVQLRGPSLYEMTIEDPAHYLECKLILEVEEAQDEFESRTVICHYPYISHAQLNDFIEEDETLLGMILLQFQMKILEDLLLFCATHYASKLLIFVDNAQAEELEIYRDFLSYENKTITSNGEKTEMVLPADRDTFDQWIDFMEDVTTKFHQTLWHEQKRNSTIREYLKRQSLFVV